MTSKQTTPDRAVRSELKRIKRQFSRLADEPAAAAPMTRLASLRVRYAELTRLINEQGGASAETLPLVAESRQVARACGVIERELKGWLEFHPSASDAFALMAEARRRLISRAVATESIPGHAEPVQDQPFSAGRLIRDARDLD